MAIKAKRGGDIVAKIWCKVTTLIFSRGSFDKTLQGNKCEETMTVCLHLQLSELKMREGASNGKPLPSHAQSAMNPNFNG
jgi:hypothetical protein